MRVRITSSEKVMRPMTWGRLYAIERLAKLPKSSLAVSMRDMGRSAATPRAVSTWLGLALGLGLGLGVVVGLGFRVGVGVRARV